MSELIIGALSGFTTFLLLFCRKKQYGISWMYMAVILLVVGTAGYIGSAVGSYMSYNTWNGMRFYSKALFVTITLLCLAKFFRKPSTQILDYYAPVDILALAIMKISCLNTGCCGGIYLFTREDGTRGQFPSQLSEMFVAVFIFCVVILLEKKRKCSGYRYYLYLILYGSSRFVFDYFRVTPSNKIYALGVPISITQMFCTILLVIGIVGICRARKQTAYNKENTQS